jgi:hypothetical protein
MLKEVLGSLLKAPEGLFSGLTLLSELLPLPLPMQSTQVHTHTPAASHVATAIISNSLEVVGLTLNKLVNA